MLPEQEINVFDCTINIILLQSPALNHQQYQQITKTTNIIQNFLQASKAQWTANH